MSACPDREPMLHSLLDGELDAANALAIEAHVQTCPGCGAELERLRALGRLVRAPGVAYPAPAGLAGRVEASLAEERPSRVRLGRLAPWGLSGAFAAIAASLALVMIAPGSEVRGIEDEVIAGHIRSLQVSHLTDVATSDRHTVKPWFNGKIDFAPPVVDLAAQGYPLAGGRLDYLHGRTVAALVFRRRQHVINLYVWPSKPGETLSGDASRQGYSIAYWTTGGLEFWAVSDIDGADLQGFAAAYRRATGSA
jgi:anti-sigma factor RsiW